MQLMSNIAIRPPDRKTPSKQAPSKQAPSRQAPSRQAPSRQAPSRQAPSRQAPSRQAPSRQAPSRQAPSRQAPSRQVPSRQAPSRQAPSRQAFLRKTSLRGGARPRPHSKRHVRKRVIALVKKRQGLPLRFPCSPSTIDYKNVALLRKCITVEGKILPRRISKVTAKQQRHIARAIKNARIVGLVPFVSRSQPSR